VTSGITTADGSSQRLDHSTWAPSKCSRGRDFLPFTMNFLLGRSYRKTEFAGPQSCLIYQIMIKTDISYTKGAMARPSLPLHPGARRYYSDAGYLS
jgi:hypothetical protein